MEWVYSLLKLLFPEDELVLFQLFLICPQSSSTPQEQESQHLPGVEAYGCHGALSWPPQLPGPHYALQEPIGRCSVHR